MKAHFSHSEVEQILRDRFNLGHDAVIFIGRKSGKTTKKVDISDADLFRKVPAFLEATDHVHRMVFLSIPDNIRAGQKIAAIKELRNFAGYGLKEAKDAVESWERFARVLHEKNRWPTISYEGQYPVYS